LRYTDLIFDLYGTLVDTHTEEGFDTWQRLAIYYGFYGADYTGNELQKAFASSMAARENAIKPNKDSYADVPCEVTFAQLFRDKGVTENTDALGFHAAQVFRMISMEYLKLYPGVKEALKQLREKGYRLWLLSNAQRVFTAYELQYLGLETYFDGIYISSDHGCRKPDIRFFNILLHEKRLDTSKCLMIGNDRMTDIAGATAAGLDTLYMHTNITPPGQKEADPALLPGKAPADCRHFEYEGSDWRDLIKYVIDL
jgi:putative hydrolase of the HAD superfamily